MRIETLRKGQVLPTATEFSRLDHNWVWVVRNDAGRMAAAFITAPAHDTVILLRLVRFGDDLPPNWISPLMKHVADECFSRGYRRFLAWQSDARGKERAIARALKLYGGYAERGEAICGLIHEPQRARQVA